MAKRYASPPIKQEYVRISAASDRWPISRATFYRAIGRGELRKFKRGQIALLRIADVDAWIEGGVETVPDA